MAYVERREGEDIVSLLKRFKKQCNEEGVFEELRRRTYFVPKRERRKRKQIFNKVHGQ